MNYKETIEYIHSTPKFARELGNNLLKKLLDNLGNPQNDLKFIHIVGTNGKGSTAVMLGEILKRSGYKTGLYTSPYIEVFNERIKINGEPIPDSDLAEIVTNIRGVIEENDTPVSEFALDTAAAFCYFKKMECDIVVLETGLGGRLDATNVIKENLATVVTSIGLDHTEYLGDTISQITREKCGVFKKNCPIVCYPDLQKDSIDVIEEEARKTNSDIYYAYMPMFTDNGIIYNKKEYSLGLNGVFQRYNAATVIETIEYLNKKTEFKIPEKAIEDGLKEVKHPARFEKFGENIILDGGHNIDAMISLCKTLKELDKPIYLCIAMMEDKDYKKCVEIISDITTKAIVTQIDMPRCCPAEKLAKVFNDNLISTEIIKNYKDALFKGIEISKNGILCICGSLYLAGKVRPLLKNL